MAYLSMMHMPGGLYGIQCLCPKGTHAWDAIPAGNEHMIPHDSASEYRTEAWLLELRHNSAAWKAICKSMGIRHWSEKHENKSEEISTSER